MSDTTVFKIADHTTNLARQKAVTQEAEARKELDELIGLDASYQER